MIVGKRRICENDQLRRDSVNKGGVFSKVSSSCRKNTDISAVPWQSTDASAVFWRNLAGSRRSRSALRRGLSGSSVSGSLASIGVPSSSSGSGSLSRNGFTAVVLKSVTPLGSCTLHVSLSMLTSLNGPVYLPLCPVLPSRPTSTSELSGRL